MTIETRDLDRRVVEEAHNWLGVKYKHLGRDEHGLDCVGLIIKVAHSLGLTDYDTTNYGRRPVPADFLREMKRYLEPIPKKEAGHGHIAMFREPRHPCHIGILEVDRFGDMWVIHAFAGTRQVSREAMTAERRSRMARAFRYVEVKDV